MTWNVMQEVTLLMIVGVAAILWWSFQRVVTGQDRIQTQLALINENLNRVNGRLGKIEMWAELHGRMDDERFQQIRSEYAAIWKHVNKEPS